MQSSSQTPLRPQSSLEEPSSAGLQGNMRSFATGRAQHGMRVGSGKHSEALQTTVMELNCMSQGHITVRQRYCKAEPLPSRVTPSVLLNQMQAYYSTSGLCDCYTGSCRNCQNQSVVLGVHASRWPAPPAATMRTAITKLRQLQPPCNARKR